MVIAINTRILSGDTAAAKLLFSYFINIAGSNPTLQFYFISADDVLPASSLSNIKNIVIKQQTANPLLWKLWYNYKLPSVLKKIKADMLVSADGVCSLRTKLPQYVLVNDLAFLHHPEWNNKRYVRFIKTNMPAALQKAKGIITFSESCKNEIAEKFKIEEEKITVSSFGNNKKYHSINWEEREKIKEKYAEGNEYFLFNGAIHSRSNLVNLLKAFSQFKKRQKSSMQLVMLADNIPAKNEFVDSLRLYKYRNEIKLISGISEEETFYITAASWCVVNLSPLYSDINFLQNALWCEVPVITGNSAQAKELLADAALYASPAFVDTIAAQLMLVYKDENKRAELIEKGKRLLHNNSVMENAGKLWHNLLHLQPQQ
jgi:glycosyltransferase involved in cell wall biosynthesis